MSRVDTVLDSYITAAAEELKRLYDAKYVSFREIQIGLQSVGLDLHLENWLYDTLRRQND